MSTNNSDKTHDVDGSESTGFQYTPAIRPPLDVRGKAKSKTPTATKRFSVGTPSAPENTPQHSLPTPKTPAVPSNGPGDVKNPTTPTVRPFMIAQNSLGSDVRESNARLPSTEMSSLQHKTFAKKTSETASPMHIPTSSSEAETLPLAEPEPPGSNDCSPTQENVSVALRKDVEISNLDRESKTIEAGKVPQEENDSVGKPAPHWLKLYAVENAARPGDIAAPHAEFVQGQDPSTTNGVDQEGTARSAIRAHRVQKSRINSKRPSQAATRPPGNSAYTSTDIMQILSHTFEKEQKAAVEKAESRLRDQDLIIHKQSLEIEALKHANAGLEKEKITLSKTVESQNIAIDKLRRLANQLQSALKVIESELAAVSAGKDKFHDELQSLRLQLSNLVAEVKARVDENAQIKSAMKEYRRGSEEHFCNLQAELVTCSTKLTLLEKQLSEYAGLLAEERSRSAQLDAELRALRCDSTNEIVRQLENMQQSISEDRDNYRLATEKQAERFTTATAQLMILDGELEDALRKVKDKDRLVKEASDTIRIKDEQLSGTAEILRDKDEEIGALKSTNEDKINEIKTIAETLRLERASKSGFQIMYQDTVDDCNSLRRDLEKIQADNIEKRQKRRSFLREITTNYKRRLDKKDEDIAKMQRQLKVNDDTIIGLGKDLVSLQYDLNDKDDEFEEFQLEHGEDCHDDENCPAQEVLDQIDTEVDCMLEAQSVVKIEISGHSVVQKVRYLSHLLVARHRATLPASARNDIVPETQMLGNSKVAHSDDAEVESAPSSSPSELEGSVQSTSPSGGRHFSPLQADGPRRSSMSVFAQRSLSPTAARADRGTGRDQTNKMEHLNLHQAGSNSFASDAKHKQQPTTVLQRGKLGSNQMTTTLIIPNVNSTRITTEQPAGRTGPITGERKRTSQGGPEKEPKRAKRAHSNSFAAPERASFQSNNKSSCLNHVAGNANPTGENLDGTADNKVSGDNDPSRTRKHVQRSSQGSERYDLRGVTKH